ncbi:16S rRNA (guanine(527)-N(7))-methyltransferase RsmG [Malacoplasma muris]|uniref:16S rRNA (guanine(527)-N(7))-methyltransferase RsmG n=1 Tax=Malacoplasma muris TaxID=2119 RepID=UPI00398F477F
MNRNEFIKKIKEEFNIKNEKYIMEKIDKYIVLLNEYNKKFNLTRLNKDDIIFSQYFYESIIPYIGFDFSKIKELLDIGSGSGIPGIVLKIIFNDINLTIIESNRKKCEFLQILTNELNLENVKIIYDRVENCSKIFTESFDLITCRAVASLKILIEICFPLSKIGATLIFPKSINYLDELNDAQTIIKNVFAQNYKIKKFVYNNKEFNTFFFTKTNKTPTLYPRQWKDIIKS